MTKVMISTGEASGEMHGAKLAKALWEIEPDCQIFGMGGQTMAAAGVELVQDIADLGVIGLIEVLKNLPRLFALKDRLVQIMMEERPDVLVVIDYPEFNVRLAKEAYKRGIPVVFFISPSAWAWRKGRARDVAKIASRVAAIFPFEAKVYEEASAPVTFVGHPLLDIVQPSMTVEESRRYFEAADDKPVVLLMPGSREQEVLGLLPALLDGAKIIQETLPDSQFYIPLASTISRSMIEEVLEAYELPAQITTGYTYDLMQIGHVALAASGTATLETAIMNLPTVLVYRVNPITYFLGKFLVKIPHVGLPNIVAGRKVIPELLQEQVQGEAIAKEALNILTNPQVYSTMKQDLAEVRRMLGEGGAVTRTAQVVLEVAREKRGQA